MQDRAGNREHPMPDAAMCMYVDVCRYKESRTAGVQMRMILGDGLLCSL